MRSTKPAGRREVGINEPNGFGLYDMSEGVHEWCSDYYDYNYYRYSPGAKSAAALRPDNAALRAAAHGGIEIKFSRCAARSSLPPSFQYADYGFRVAVTDRINAFKPFKSFKPFKTFGIDQRSISGQPLVPRVRLFV